MAWADYDNDGDLDFVVGNQEVPPEIFENTGNCSFMPAPVALTKSAASVDDIRWVDYDGDGNLDLFAGSVFKNDGFKNFALVTGVASGIWGDYDGDRDLDRMSDTSVYENTTAAPQSLFSQVWTSDDANENGAWIDCDNDGDLDLWMTNWNGRSSHKVMRNDGAEGFSLAWEEPERNSSSGTAKAADFDADGYMDFVTDKYPGPVVYHNNGDCTFRKQWAAASTGEVQDIAVGDMNGDGLLDIVAIGGSWWGDGNTYVFTQNTDGTFSTARTSASLLTRRNVSLSDIDNDGDLDAAFANYDTASEVCLNDGSAYLECTSPLPTANSVLWGSYANTSAAKLVLTSTDGSTMGFYTYNSVAKTFTQDFFISGLNYPSVVQWGDFDGNGTWDILANDDEVPAQIYSWNGSTFAQVWRAPVTSWNYSPALGDYDGDGDLDVTVSFGWPDMYQVVYRNESTSNRARLPDLPTYGVIANDSRTVCAPGKLTTLCPINTGPYLHIPVRLIDADSDPTGRVALLYDAGDGAGWKEATLTGPTTGLSTSPGGWKHFLEWNVAHDGITSGDVHIRLRVAQNPAKVTFPMLRSGITSAISFVRYRIDTTVPPASREKDVDGDRWSATQDCNDRASSCTDDCTMNADHDDTPDCLDRCLDVDGDNYGIGSQRKVGSSLANVGDCSTGDAEACVWGDDECVDADCNDMASTCTHDCTTNTDDDGHPDCLDACSDADKDDYGEKGSGDGCLTEGASGGTTPCPDVGAACLGADCDDSASTCTTTCEDTDKDGRFDCADACLDIDHDAYGATNYAASGCTRDGTDNCDVGFDCLDTDCDDHANSCAIDCTTNADHDDTPDCLDRCLDADGDDHGVGPQRQVASSVSVGSCSTGGSAPCNWGDTDCLGPDCDDTASTCTVDCTSDVDNDRLVDCRDACLDADKDGYGAKGPGDGCVIDGASGDTTACPHLGTACYGINCFDAASACSLECTNPDEPVIAYAGDAQTVGELTYVVLNGSRSCNAPTSGSSGLSFRWTQEQGELCLRDPLSCLNDQRSPQPGFLAPRVFCDTDLTFSLIVSDGIHESAADTTVVHVRNSVNEPPTALATGPARAFSGDKVTLDASGFYRPQLRQPWACFPLAPSRRACGLA